MVDWRASWRLRLEDLKLWWRHYNILVRKYNLNEMALREHYLGVGTRQRIQSFMISSCGGWRYAVLGFCFVKKIDGGEREWRFGTRVHLHPVCLLNFQNLKTLRKNMKKIEQKHTQVMNAREKFRQKIPFFLLCTKKKNF